MLSACGAAYHPGMTLLDIEGIRLEVVLVDGPRTKAPIVFLHEGLGSVGQWTHRGANWAEAICHSTGRAGVLYSRRGYGQSAQAAALRDALGADYMHIEAWQVLPELLRELKIERPILLGHSDGATIALLYASRCAVNACIAMAPHIVVEPVAIAAITQAKSAFETGDLRGRLAKHHTDVDGAFWQWNDVWLSEGFSTFDIRAECRNICSPLLLIQGMNDQYGTMLQLNEIAKLTPQAVQCRISDCGHSPQHDQHDFSTQVVTKFLRNIL